jgi:CRISPR/Cas system-associated protein endoribonuclease Cas2
LFVEFRNITNRRKAVGRKRLIDVLLHYGLDTIGATEKEEMRALALREGNHYTEAEKTALLEYCEGDVLALERLLPQMLPSIDLPLALHRGRYMKAVARMETNPFNHQTLDHFFEFFVESGMFSVSTSLYPLLTMANEYENNEKEVPDEQIPEYGSVRLVVACAVAFLSFVALAFITGTWQFAIAGVVIATIILFVSAMLQNVDEDEKVVKILPPEQCLAGLQPNTEYDFLTEFGFYELLMRSQMPIAQKFKKGVKLVLHDVRTGSGIMDAVGNELGVPRLLHRYFATGQPR